MTPDEHNAEVYGRMIGSLDETLERYCVEAKAGDVEAQRRLAKIRNWFDEKGRKIYDKCLDERGVKLDFGLQAPDSSEGGEQCKDAR